jgi:NAD(P)-dependent dehydrogenase (short-subunit alcohol dehydrogenase family)
MTLDITDAKADRVAVERAFDHFGRVDVIVNNAGYGLFGAVEEVTEEQTRRQIDTGLFCALWITQAALPHLRAQRSGHIVQVSSLSGLVTIPYLGMYQAAKFGLEGYSESLVWKEVADAADGPAV